MISDKNFVDAAEGKTYFILNYGCQMNESDAEHYAGQLEEMGYAKADDFHNADIIVVNTCCVRESAEKRILGKIGELKRVKENHPGQVICVAGCMAQKDGEKLIKKHPQIDLLIGTAHVNSFKEILIDFLADKGGRIYDDMIIADSEFEGNRVRQSGFSAWIPIMYGCNNFCTYCIVPYVRGRERSREKSLILDEARQMISAGYKDITLLGQNVNSYGKTLADKPTFAQLLHEIDSIDGDYWLRFMTSHPKDCSKELIDTIANGTHISKHLHLPFQSGSDRILKAMNRHYDRKKYLDIVNYAKEKIDGVSLTSDIIVGFPGETYEDFKETLSLIREVEFTSLFTFIYSPRVGTPAAKMDDPISAEEKSKWFRELLDVQEEIAAKRCASMVNNTEKVLIESETGKNGELNGRTSGNIIVELKGDKSLIGTFQNVKITQARNWILKGELV